MYYHKTNICCIDESLFAYMAFPIEHHLRIRTTNIVERVNREIKRRCRVVSVFPDAESILRLVGCAIADYDDEWSVKRGISPKNQWMTSAQCPTNRIEPTHRRNHKFTPLDKTQSVYGIQFL